MKKTVAITVIATMLLAALSGCGCKKESNSETSINEETVTHVEVVTEVVTDEQGNTYYTETTKYIADTGEQTTTNAQQSEEDTTSPTAGDKKETSKTESKTKTTSNTNSKSANNKQSSSNTNSNSGASKSTSTPKTDSGNTNQQSSNTNTQKSETSKTSSSQTSKQNSQTSDPHAGKTWHEAVYKTVNHPAETKKVKVVDQEAYSYEEPVYEWRTFCNVCGADITTTCDEHMRAHMIAREGGRYHDDYVQVGTKTVNVPEQSHYETVVVKEAWTEKVLVKEAGWY